MNDQTGWISRRGLLQAGSAAFAGAVFGDLTSIASAATLKTGMKRARFAPYVGQKVTLARRRGAAITGVLVAVEDVPFKALAGAQDAYILRFRAKRTPDLGTQITTVKHPKFGIVDLLMSEGGKRSDGQDYLAVVNRVTSAARTR